MKEFIQQEFLRVEHIELDQWPATVQVVDSYKLILILTGNGCYRVNENQFAYQPGDSFFLGVQDQYRLLIAQQTSFYSVSFSSQYIAHLVTINGPSWTHLTGSTAYCSGSLANDPTEQDKLRALVAVLLSEERGLRPTLNNPVSDLLMQTILSVVDRLLAQHSMNRLPQQTYASELTRRVVAYISQHIGEPDRLRMDTLADAFNYSPSHLSALFKQHVGDSIQQFIIRHKLKRVAARLRHTPLSIAQIADEFGFSDVCHLNKLFKRHYNHTPTTYRQGLSC